MCSLGDLAVSSSVTIELIVEASSTGFLTNNVSVAGNEDDPDLTNNTDIEQTLVEDPPPDQGSIRVVKDFVDQTLFPEDTTAEATLIIDGGQGDQGVKEKTVKDGGDYIRSFPIGAVVNVDESLLEPDEWRKADVDGFVCVDGDDQPVFPIGTGGTATGYDIQIIDGEITCTFTNVRRHAELVVTKIVAANDNNSEWDISVGGQQVDLLSDGETTEAIPVPLGTHIVVESGPASDSSTVACRNDEPVESRSVSVTFATEGETVTCTFTNTLPPPQQFIELTITKVVDVEEGATGPAGDFQIELDCGADGALPFSPGPSGGTSQVLTVPSGATCSLTESASQGADVIEGLFVEKQLSFSGNLRVTNRFLSDEPSPSPTPVVQQAAPPPPISVTVTKVVTTSGLGVAPEAGTEFGFRLDCLGPDFDFSLEDGESFTATISANTQCSLTETDRQGASVVSGEFGGTLLTSSSSFTVTNNYHVDEPVVAGTNITKTLVSADPAAVGEPVVFEVAVTFEGTVLPNAELIDVYEREFIEFVSASVGGVPLSCDSFDLGADGMVVCALGDASGPFTVRLTYVAVRATLPDRTLDSAEVRFDVDGPGGEAAQTIGPVDDDVEIIEVLALPPLGDGETAPPPAGWLALAAAGSVAGLGAWRLARRRRYASDDDIAA